MTTGRMFELKEPSRTQRRIATFLRNFSKHDPDESKVLHSETELAAYYELAKGLHSPDILTTIGAHIIHCGVFRAGSLCVMGLGQRESGREELPLVAIDSYGSMTPKGECDYVITRRKLHQFSLSKHVFLVMARDDEFFRHFLISSPLIFIDTLHSYEQTKKELKIIAPNLLPGGWLVLHDYCDESPGVIQAVDEFLASRPGYFETYTLPKRSTTIFLNLIK